MTRSVALPRRLTRLMIVAVVLSVALPAAANRRDQRAADLFTEGVRLIRSGKYAEGAAKMRAALERASEPTDEQGSSTRFLARRYDPYYWLGVAQMEMGLDEQALQSFESSLGIVPVGRKDALIKGWPEEYADLQRRMTSLTRRLESSVVAEVRPTPLPLPPSEPTPKAAAPPSPPVPSPAQPVATATPFVIRIATAPATRTSAAPVSTPAAATRLAAVDAVISRYRTWMADEVLGAEATRLLGARTTRLESMSTRQSSPASVQTALAVEESHFKAVVMPALTARVLQAALDAFGRQDWPLVKAHLRLARNVDPASPRADILECASLATQYVLEGRRTEPLLSASRERLRSWRQKVGDGRPLPAIISPSIGTLLLTPGAGDKDPRTP